MRYRVHYEDNAHILDFEIESEYYIADERLNIDIYAKAKELGGNPSYCRYLEVKGEPCRIAGQVRFY